MIEKELVGAHFLVPTHYQEVSEGYLDRATFAACLQKGAVIGHYDAIGCFHIDYQLNQKYQKIIPVLAKAFSYELRDKRYRRFKLAALEKGTLILRLEWNVAEFLNVHEMSFDFAKRIQDATGCIALLVDMHGPSYEVLIPDTVVKVFGNKNFVQPVPVHNIPYQANLDSRI